MTAPARPFARAGCTKSYPLRRVPMRSLPLPLLIAVIIPGCTAVRQVQPAELAPPHPPTRVWMTRPDHSTIVFDSARASGDSLVGVVNGAPERLPLSDATVLRAREPSTARTGALMLSLGGAAAVVTLYAVSHGWLDKTPPDSCPPPSWDCGGPGLCCTT
jgi:hypothetical protein